MRRSIREFAEAGGVIYSEGAGTAYLCRSFQLDPGGPVYPGVGLIDADAVGLQQGMAMLDATTMEESILGSADRRIQGVTLGDWGVRADSLVHGAGVLPVLKLRLDSGAIVAEGYSPTAESVCTFSFLHFASCPSAMRALVDAAAVFIQATTHDREPS
jgi:cobyrinic acid a,c-diamide synthase